MEEVKQTEVKNDPKVDELFKAGAHFGFVRSRRHPSVKPYLYGVKNRIEIFDLEKTSVKLDEALEFVKSLGASSSMLLLVGGKSEAREAIRKAAGLLDMPFVAGRWIGGTMTNFSEIRKRVTKLEDLTAQKEKGELMKYTKKERLLIDREIEKLRRFFQGLVLMKELPKALFVIDPKHEEIAVREAKQHGIPVIALAGSDCDLSDVDYAIPGNDASVPSVTFFVDKVVAAYREGKQGK